MSFWIFKHGGAWPVEGKKHKTLCKLHQTKITFRGPCSRTSQQNILHISLLFLKFCFLLKRMYTQIHTLDMHMYVAINVHVFHLNQMLSNITFFRDRKINPYFVLYINELIFFFCKSRIFFGSYYQLKYYFL